MENEREWWWIDEEAKLESEAIAEAVKALGLLKHSFPVIASGCWWEATPAKAKEGENGK